MKTKHLAVAGFAVALLIAVAVAVVAWPSPLEPSDSRWIEQALRRHLRLPEIDHRLNAVFRVLPGESQYELLYACRQDVAETRSFYEKQLTDPNDEAGGVAAIKLAGLRAGRKCTVRNYYSEIANVYCVTLEASGEEEQAILSALETLPETMLLSPDGPLTAATERERYGGFVLYNLEPLSAVLPFDKPVVSRAYYAPEDPAEREELSAKLSADAGLKAKEATLAGLIDGFKVLVSPFKTESGIDLITVRIQK